MDPEKRLSLTIIGEGRGEPIQGKIAIGCVIRNRVIIRGKTYEEICLEPKQFSCWNDNDPNRKLLDELAGNEILMGDFRECVWVAQGIYRGFIKDNTKRAQYYLTEKLYTENRPNWARAVADSVQIGSQIFFNV